MSDHYTRDRVSAASSEDVRIIGALFGKQSGSNVEICTSDDLLFSLAADGTPTIDTAVLTSKIELVTTVFPEYELLGWYSNGVSATSTDMAIHQQLLDVNEAPLFMQLDPDISMSQRQLPVSIYRSRTEVKDGVAVQAFQRLEFRITATEAEAIAMDTISSEARAGVGDASGMVAHISKLEMAVGSLSDRITTLATYLRAVKEGSVPRDRALLRRVASIALRMPMPLPPELATALAADKNESTMVQLLGVSTRQAFELGEVTDKLLPIVATRKQQARLGTAAPLGKTAIDILLQ
jgi:COP9 signalosome complex subunit 6